ncbi:MAG: DUF5694 domain-containing protein [Gemmatimonadota bacterium]
MQARIQATLLAIVVCLLSALPVPAQSLVDGERPQVLILGTYHFANPGRDMVKVDVADVLSQTRQAEIERVIDALERFRPTKIAVEVVPAAARRMDSLYSAYRLGRHELSRSETEQLGFRLAARLGHARLHAINVLEEDLPFDAMLEYAQVHDSSFLAFVDRERARDAEEFNRQQEQNSVGEILRLRNDPDSLAADHGIYMRFARVGAGDTYIGADLVARWYTRNIKIFANLQRITVPGDRVLVIYGSGHVPTLRELVTYDPEMVLVETMPYLPQS